MLTGMNRVEQTKGVASIEIRPPQHFNWPALTVCSAYGLLLLLPTLLAILSVSLIGFGLFTIAIPLVTLAGATFFLPFGFGNPHVGRLAKALRTSEQSSGQTFLVQVTAVPRLRSGVRALLEDADDVGWLTCSEEGLVFAGDSLNLWLPSSQIKTIRRENGGVRGLFLYSRVTIEVSEVPNFRWLKFAERSSWSLPTSRAVTRGMYREMSRNTTCQNGPGSDSTQR
jgi:hypothetical protein